MSIRVNDYIGKVSFSDSKLGLPYHIASINDVQVHKIEKSLKAEEYINFICPNDWVKFQVPDISVLFIFTSEVVEFTKLMKGNNKTTENLQTFNIKFSLTLFI